MLKKVYRWYLCSMESLSWTRIPPACAYYNIQLHADIYIYIYMYLYIYICIYMYIYTNTHKHTYIYIHTHISNIDKTRKPWRKSWFCIQRLNETNLIDVGSTKPTWTSMWLPLFNGFFEDCEWWKVFHITWTSSQIFSPKWEKDSVPCKTVRTGQE